jgi:DNA-binding GntR family transcriptional regulator
VTSFSAEGRIEPVVQESTPGLIAARIREAIATGVIAPGAQISEATYARQLNVSRGPLREGLQRLAQEGLLTAHRNRGHFVIEMTPENVVDMYIARAAVERAAAALVHQRDRDTAAAELLTLCDEMAEAAKSGDTHRVSEIDVAFHKAYVRASGSPRLIRIHETLMTETRMCIAALEPTYALGDVRVAEHRRIAKSFTNGDPAETDRLLVEHMDDAVSRLTQEAGQSDDVETNSARHDPLSQPAARRTR